jgi:hypothetical protein
MTRETFFTTVQKGLESGCRNQATSAALTQECDRHRRTSYAQNRAVNPDVRAHDTNPRGNNEQSEQKNEREEKNEA